MCLRDLGVQISNDLKFTQHIDNVITSVKRLGGMALITFRTRSRYVMVTLSRQSAPCKHLGTVVLSHTLADKEFSGVPR